MKEYLVIRSWKYGVDFMQKACLIKITQEKKYYGVRHLRRKLEELKGGIRNLMGVSTI